MKSSSGIPMLQKLILVALCWAAPLRADAGGYEFFVIPTTDLMKVAKTDEAVLALAPATLADLACARGSFEGDHVYLDLNGPTGRWGVSFRRTGQPAFPQFPDDFDYSIGIGKGPKDWDVLLSQGEALRHGQSFLSFGWMKQTFTVIIRPINYKR